MLHSSFRGGRRPSSRGADLFRRGGTPFDTGPSLSRRNSRPRPPGDCLGRPREPILPFRLVDETPRNCKPLRPRERREGRRARSRVRAAPRSIRAAIELRARLDDGDEGDDLHIKREPAALRGAETCRRARSDRAYAGRVAATPRALPENPPGDAFGRRARRAVWPPRDAAPRRRPTMAHPLDTCSLQSQTSYISASRQTSAPLEEFMIRRRPAREDRTPRICCSKARRPNSLRRAVQTHVRSAPRRRRLMPPRAGWQRPNTRNRSYNIRQAADPIPDQDHMPPRPNSAIGNRSGFRYAAKVDMRRLPPSKHPRPSGRLVHVSIRREDAAGTCNAAKFSKRNLDRIPRRRSPRTIRVAASPASADYPRRGRAATHLHGLSASRRRRDPSSPRTIRVAAAASPRPLVSADYPRRCRDTRLLVASRGRRAVAARAGSVVAGTATRRSTCRRSCSRTGTARRRSSPAATGCWISATTRRAARDPNGACDTHVASGAAWGEA